MNEQVESSYEEALSHEDNTSNFRKELETLINKNCMENGSDTPDFILAEFLLDCLCTFDKTVNRRAIWYGHKSTFVEEISSPLAIEASEDQAPHCGCCHSRCG